MSIQASICSVIVCLASMSYTVHATTIYVSKNGDDANSGSSWAAAKATVQAGIDAAQSGDQVWVAVGRYVGCIGLKSGIALYGGFVGTETDLSQRKWTLHRSILDGNQFRTVVTIASGATAATRIDGFTICNGKYYWGGGVSCGAGSATIANNIIACNSADNGSGSGMGGGIYVSGVSAAPVIAGNIIMANTAGTNGGGIYCDAYSTLTLSNNVVIGNGAKQGGAIYCTSLHGFDVINNTIAYNIASSNGGAMNFSSSAVAAITNTIVAFNSSGINGNGSDTVTLQYNCIYGNDEYDFSGLADPIGANGNFSSDPHLADPIYGNVHVQPGSPCIDAGDDSVVLHDGVDIDGQPRVYGARVDIGADESDGTAWDVRPSVIVRVAPGGDDANDGLSWSLAKRTVQAAINVATGGEVWVAAGTYVERITLGGYTHVYGGFAGVETERSQRDWSANKTILDGNQEGRVVIATNVAYGQSTIDGFVIRNGGRPFSGAGIFCLRASPIISNNAIMANTATDSGGGIYCYTSCPAIRNNVISDNANGGIACGYSSRPTIEGNTISDNVGNGIVCAGDSPATIIGNTISRNHGTGISGPATLIAGNVITGNTSADYGGGISGSATLIANNTVAGNSSCSDMVGGIYCRADSTIVNTIVAFNSCGICCAPGATVSVRNSCVYGNFSYDYSGLSDPTGTDGNISADPKLARPFCIDVHIQPDSPCIDAGDTSIVQADWIDMDGQPRPATRVDIGADESDGTVWPPGTARIVRVGSDGDDANDGSTWASAKRTVQAAVDAVAFCQGGQVWVKAGTYAENVVILFPVAVYGGFAGGETSLLSRNRATNRTILDGRQVGSVVRAGPGAGRDGRIDGFVIRNGSGTGSTQLARESTAMLRI